jgi:glycosyltransferase involved in cell wall biosynthesis
MASIDSIEIASQEKGAKRLRILVLASFCDPEAVSMPYVTYSHAAALAKLHEVTLVIGAPTEDKVRRAKGQFRSIEVVRMPTLEGIYEWIFRNILKSNFDTQVLTALTYPFSLAFEWYAWRLLKRRILGGNFDVVLRLLPMSPVIGSPFARILRKGPIPFVIGPINGGLPWPPGFTQLESQREWISQFRNLYRHLPFSGSTYRYAAAVIAASSQTYSEFDGYRDKLFFVTEPGIDSSLCFGDTRSSDPGAKCQMLFVGGLVPRKACDLALRSAASFLRHGLAYLTVVGDGPERARLEGLASSLGITDAVRFCGGLSHAEVLKQMRSADVFIFPTLRDNGAGVVFEALATGSVPVVADFGGPGDIVHPEVGFKVPLTNENDFVVRLEEALAQVVQDRKLLERLRQQGMRYAQERLTWEAKAKDTTKVLEWVLGWGPKPDLLPPKSLGKKAVLPYGGDVQTEMPVTGDR